MAVLPTPPIQSYPKELLGHLDENGRLPANILAVQEGSSPTLTMCRTPMRSLLAMAAEVKSDLNITLKVSSSQDSYRTLLTQTTIFNQRYTTERLDPTPDKNCGGTLYWKVPHNPPYATAACPGTSNHGLALACDFVLDTQGRLVNWLINNAIKYGFGAELQSEPWHWRYITGSNIPAATLAFEEGNMEISDESAEKIRRYNWYRPLRADGTGDSAGTIVLDIQAKVTQILAATTQILADIAAIDCGGTTDHTHEFSGSTGDPV
jgi:hypothetical protein